MNVKKGILWSMLALMIAAISVSCEKEKEVIQEASIVGTWTVVDFVRTNCTDGNNSTITLDCPTFCMTYTFNAEGILTHSYIDPNYPAPVVTEVTYTYSGNTLTSCDLDGTSNCDSSTTIVLSGDNMSISTVEDIGVSSCDLTINLTRN